MSETGIAFDDTQRLDYDVNGNLIYAGKAEVGSATSAAVWKVQELTYDGSNQLTSVLHAGAGLYAHVWDDRASLSYG